MHELESSSPSPNTAQFQHLPVESWGVGRPVSTGETRAALTRAFLHKRSICSVFNVVEENPVSDLRLRVALRNMT